MNAKAEFMGFTKDLPKIICALVQDVGYANNNKKIRLLKVGYSKQDYSYFLKTLDFDYDDGYGSEELGGTIWFEDGTYADRGEYDGSEWWEYHKTPPIPKELTNQERTL